MSADLDAVGPLARRIADAAVAAARADEGVLALTLGGSAALGALDPYSDLDLVAVCREQDHARLLGDAAELAARLGPLVACFSGELFEALDAIGVLRSAALGPLLAARDGRRPQGVRRLEQHAGGHERALLVRTVGAHSRAACVDALRAATELYRQLRDAADDGTLVRRDAAEALAVAYLDEVAGAG